MPYHRRFRTLHLLLLVWLAGLAVVAVDLFDAGDAARAAPGNVRMPYTFLGMPVLDGFRLDGRIGVDMRWGALVLLVGPPLLALAIGVVQSRRAWSRRSIGVAQP